MIPGLSIDVLLNVHVAISLVAIATGLWAMGVLATGRWLPVWQAIFLVTTALTSITGFLFPFSGVTPAFLFGVISLVLLAVAAAALPVRATRRLAAIAYAVTATFALYLNLVVLVVQSFQKLSALQPLAPNQNEPPFLAAQLVVLAAVLLIGFFSARRRIV
ncbi:hypothetical protein MWN33_06715 [Starkeya koreensis]|uniref:DUF420 domain-containing protein n=1 Tax=Ancylobacter koreensis TaxID=266121 RepID=A0ABT0DKD3_9HYPH|nr:hypothetical protein [Ancylobacter koreensis]MCK0207725.1 hypothetical protein [Ancylobacter koreensis]